MKWKRDVPKNLPQENKYEYTYLFLTTRDLYWYGNGYCKNSLRITKTFRYWKKIPIHYVWTKPLWHVTKSWNGHWTKDAKWCVKLDMYITPSTDILYGFFVITTTNKNGSKCALFRVCLYKQLQSNKCNALIAAWKCCVINYCLITTVVLCTTKRNLTVIETSIFISFYIHMFTCLATLFISVIYHV